MPGSQQPIAPPPRRTFSYRTVRMLVMLGLIIVVMGWIGIQSLLHRGTPKQSSSQSATSTVALADFCKNSKTLDAPAYQANTGQPMALFSRSSTDANVSYSGVYVFGTAPLHSDLREAYTTVGQNLSATRSQNKTPVVIGCITRSNEQRTDQSCTYSDNKIIPVYTASYRLTVYEAHSRKVLKQTDVPAEQTYTCLSFTTYDGKGFYHTWSRATAAQTLYEFAR